MQFSSWHNGGNVKVIGPDFNEDAFASYTPDDVYMIRVIGDSVEFLKDGSVFYTAAASAPTFPLQFGLSIWHNGVGFDDVTISSVNN